VTDSIWTDAVWHKSSRSNGGGQCVEIAVHADLVAVRDSKDPDGAMLIFPARTWQSFLGWIVDNDELTNLGR
jgi:hypothetical protein